MSKRGLARKYNLVSNELPFFVAKACITKEKITENGAPLVSLNYRQKSFVNDRANNRHGTDGRKGPKRLRALRHTPLNSTICGINFSLLHDGVGFFVKP